MAGTVTCSYRLTLVNGSIFIDQNISSVVTTQMTQAYSNNIQSIPTTSAGTVVSIASSVSTTGQALFQNLDPTNFVELGVQVSGTFYPLVKLFAGEYALFRLDSAATLYARANTASISLQNFVCSA